jgi:hypothetical protein
MTQHFSRGARTFGQLKPVAVIFESPPCVGFTRYPVPSKDAVDLARSHPNKSWARRWLRQRGLR